MPDPQQDQQQPLRLPPGATLVNGGTSLPTSTAKLPPGATLVSGQLPQPPAPPGAVSRFATSAREAVGIPENPGADLAGGLKYAANNPGEAAKELALSPVEAYKNAVNLQENRMIDAYKRGDYGQALLHGMYYLLSPVGGANLGTASEQAKQGDIAGSLGTTLGTALPAVVGSPEARAAAGKVTAPIRSAVATGVEKSAPAVSTAATIGGAGHELFSGRPWSAAIIANEGKPGITKAMTGLADFIRPGDNIQPFPRSLATIHDAINFLRSPGIEGEEATAAQQGTVHQGMVVPPASGIIPAGAGAASSTPGASTVPRVPSGESVLNQALTSLDNKTLLKVARSRGIDVSAETNLKPGVANNKLVNKIINDFTPEELDEVRNTGMEVSAHKPVPGPNITPEAGQEAWHYKVLSTYFPDVAIPKTMAARAQATIAQRPSFDSFYQAAAKKQLPATATDADVSQAAARLKQSDENLEQILLDSIAKVRGAKSGAVQ